MKINSKIQKAGGGSGGLARHYTGIASEFKAAAYFAERGYEVFFPSSSQSRCDFIASDNEQTIKVQVKTITYDKVGKYVYAKARLGAKTDYRRMYDHQDADMFMFVGIGEMYLIPAKHLMGLTCITFGNDNPNYKPKRRKGSPEIDPKIFKVEYI